MEVIGTSLAAEAIPLDEAVAPARTALVVGSEFNGLGTITLGACDQLIRIPMAVGTDSLNVGVAAAVCLHPFARKNRV